MNHADDRLDDLEQMVVNALFDGASYTEQSDCLEALAERLRSKARELRSTRIRLYTEGDAIEITQEQARRLLDAGLAHPNQSVLGTPDDDGAMRLAWVMAYPGDTAPDFPFPADRWMWQTGDQWMAVADWEDETEWFADCVRDGTSMPAKRVRQLWDLPMEPATLVFRREDGTPVDDMPVKPFYEARFTPEAWSNNNAIEVDPEGPTTWNCTAVVEAHAGYFKRLVTREFGGVWNDDGELLDNDDVLKGDPAAPQWVREWRGPFTIYVTRRRGPA